MYRRALVLLAFVAACRLALAAQQPQRLDGQTPTFRVQVDTVVLDAVVTDREGNPIKGLSADDFDIVEDGAPQDITSFQEVDVPIEQTDRPLFATGAIEPDVQSNTGPEGRVYLFALDQVLGEQALRTRRFLRRFVEKYMADNDVAAVVFLGQAQASKSQDFTSNRRLLLNAIDSFSGGFPREDAPPTTPIPGGAAPPQNTRNMEATFQVRFLMAHLRQLTESVAQIRGRRKSFLFFSTGFPVDMFRIIDYRGGTLTIEEEDAHKLVPSATRGDVTFYSVDPRGLTPDGDVGGEAPLSTDAIAGPAPTRSLRTLAEATGGFGLVNSNSFEQAFTRIVRENSSYYILGFSSTNERKDGRYRKLQVRMRRPGLEVRARAGYVAPIRKERTEVPPPPKSPLSAATSDALGTPIAVSGVPIRVFAAPYKSQGKSASVALAVEIEAAGVDLTRDGDQYVGQLEVGFLSTDANSRVHPGEAYGTKLALKPETYERVRQSGMRVLSETTLPPGRYQLRVAAGNRNGKAGSVIYDLVVPDFSSGPLAMSGVALTSVNASSVMTVRARDPLAKLLPGPATTTRDFARGDRLALFLEVYDNQRGGTTRTLEFRTELRAEGGAVVRSVVQQRSSTELDGKAGGYGFTPELSLEDVAPGLYVIHVEARSNQGARPTVTRDILIRVH